MREGIREKRLGRLFFAFPRGWPGFALFLLRAVSALAIIVQGVSWIAAPDARAVAWLGGLFAVGAGALLLVGFLTPIVAALVAVGVAAVGFSFLPVSSPTLFDSRSSLIFGITMLAAVGALGPGAFSVDARVFGRREIIIPRRHE